MADRHYNADSAHLSAFDVPVPGHGGRLRVTSARAGLLVQARTRRRLPHEAGFLPSSSAVN